MRRIFDELFEHPQEVFDLLFFFAGPYVALLLKEGRHTITAWVFAALWWYYYFIVCRRRDNFK